jgi:hypothetical protein
MNVIPTPPEPPPVARHPRDCQVGHLRFQGSARLGRGFRKMAMPFLSLFASTYAHTRVHFSLRGQGADDENATFNATSGVVVVR